jgi:hypothetical protein
MFAGQQLPNAADQNAAVTLQKIDARLQIPFVHVQTADLRLQQPCITVQTAIVNRQTGFVGRQTSIANDPFGRIVPSMSASVPAGTDDATFSPRGGIVLLATRCRARTRSSRRHRPDRGRGAGAITASRRRPRSRPRNYVEQHFVGFVRHGLLGFNTLQDYKDYDVRTHHTNADFYERLSEEELQEAANRSKLTNGLLAAEKGRERPSRCKNLITRPSRAYLMIGACQ